MFHESLCHLMLMRVNDLEQRIDWVCTTAHKCTHTHTRHIAYTKTHGMTTFIRALWCLKRTAKPISSCSNSSSKNNNNAAAAAEITFRWKKKLRGLLHLMWLFRCAKTAVRRENMVSLSVTQTTHTTIDSLEIIKLNSPLLNRFEFFSPSFSRFS